MNAASHPIGRWKLLIAYDGRPYQGWQSQPGGNTIQDHLEKVLQTISRQKVSVHGSGRTDAGVHADGQVAHFDAAVSPGLGPDSWRKALNSLLPPEIRVLSCEKCVNDFHARFSAREKTYHYLIHNHEILPPRMAGLAWKVDRPLAIEALVERARVFLGTHDFSGFSCNRGKSSPKPATTIRTITEFKVLRSGTHSIIVVATGNGFLYKMVRCLVGALIDSAQKGASPKALEQVLHHGRRDIPTCAPPDGLYLKRVVY
ncbi:MAG: tRNA pseudouridine(38-40) synthase TruA [Verrucomicrobiota bacterium]